MRLWEEAGEDDTTGIGGGGGGDGGGDSRMLVHGGVHSRIFFLWSAQVYLRTAAGCPAIFLSLRQHLDGSVLG